MKRLVPIVVLILVAGGFFVWFAGKPRQVACTMEAKICPDGTAVGRVGPACEFAPCPTGKTNAESPLTFTSSVFVHDQTIPKNYTCDGENISPPLTVSGVPGGTKSLALIVDDPDAPGGTWVHWVVWNIPPDTKEIAAGSTPSGVFEGTTSFGKPGYGGPCPPSGVHRYFFKLFALDTTFGLTNQATASDVEQVMKGHIIAQTQLIGRYGR